MPTWPFFAPLEKQVVALLLEAAPLSRESIARQLGESADGRLKYCLAFLVDREILYTGREGYRLCITDDQREGLTRWLRQTADKQKGGHGPAGHGPLDDASVG